MVLFLPLPLTQTDFGTAVRYWRQQRNCNRNYWQDEEVFIPQRVFLATNL
jgi:hypothetical protein